MSDVELWPPRVRFRKVKLEGKLRVRPLTSGVLSE